MEGMNYMQNILTWYFLIGLKWWHWKPQLSDGILANFVYDGKLIWLPTSPTMYLRP